ncbi:MAG: SLBB domain-containing protein [Myxococcales bacterium]|nr:SLBB domain-containing protein [Myxococcales bacterium]
MTPKSGDAIEVRFSREPDRGGTFQIDDTGEVPLPFLGRLQILELNTGELRALLTRRYEEQLPNQTVYVRVLRKVRVLGAVTEPGVYFVDDTTNLADAIARAGGVRPDGNLTAVRIRREGREVTTNIKVAAMSVPKLESGDQIFVPRRTWLARNGMSLLASVITVAGIVAGIVVR